ncbi:MAG: FAD-dependent oxidoreductase [Lachnospiraceae bacterium]|nr:FAD-dependent oxidoreductase [Lachnospiraceae bacterium]
MKNARRMTALAMSAAMIASFAATSAMADGLNAGTFTGSADGFGGKVNVTITVDESGAITEAVVEGADETPTIGGAAVEELGAQIVAAQGAEIDGVAGASLTSEGAKAAAAKAIEAASGVEAAPAAELAFTAGTYTGVGEGYNGPVSLDVTFDEGKITDIAVAGSAETAHVGTPAFDIMLNDAIAANGSGVDAVSGATFTSRAVKEALNDAAEQAGCTNLDAFKENTVAHEAQADIEVTADVIVVGAGGAGMGAAAQAAQNGESVLVIEENAEIGGNTLVSGGQFQATMPYLVWDPADPDATEAVWDYDGQTYAKVMSAHGNIDVLKQIAAWSEEPFNGDYFVDHEYVAGEIAELSQQGVHEEYLPVLQELKAEINAYLEWAQPKLDAGIPESEITLFSTDNLHIFQTYYGGLRQNADKTDWIYGNVDLVTQFVKGGYELKTWLEDQGAKFADGEALTLIGALWYRENRQLGADIDGDGEMEATGNWGAYFAPTLNTLMETSEKAEENQIMTRTKAESLIIEDGKVVGVNAVMYDGTKVIAHANDGVVLATGGYAANISKVMETNQYWNTEYITDATKTTNRSSLVGDGLDMGAEAGADLVGTGWAQMMPISWVDNGNLAFGRGGYAAYINPTTGKRFVDESAERDVLSLGEFQNGVEVNGAQGVFLEFTNADQAIGRPYPYDDYSTGEIVINYDQVDGRVYYVSNQDELQAVLDEFGMEADPAVVYETIEAYDKALMTNTEAEVHKSLGDNIIGKADKDETGNYDVDSYQLDGVKLRIRVMAPSTHHTMGGLSIDTERHVLDAEGNIIEGLYAAGEVTGGIHGGNRLGGNAIVEIFVSGRTAANTIVADKAE